MPMDNQLEQLTTKDAFEGRLNYDRRAAFEEYQRNLAKELEPELEDATNYAWSSPEHLMNVLRLMEQFSRVPGQLGTGAENALLLYQKFQQNAKKLMENRVTVELNLYKKEGTRAILLYKYNSGKVKTYRTIVKAFDVSQLKDPPAFQEPPVQHTPLVTFLSAVAKAQQDEGFITTYDSNWTHSTVIPAIDGEQPAHLVLPAELSEEEFKCEAMYCFTLYEMSKKEGFAMNPEAEFIARCAANIACLRFGWQPSLLRALPQSVDKPGEKRSLLNRAFNVSDRTLKKLNALINSGVAQ